MFLIEFGCLVFQLSVLLRLVIRCSELNSVVIVAEPEPLQELAKSMPTRYVPPSMRAGGAALEPISMKRQTRRQPRHAPNLTSETDFPTLGAAPPPVDTWVFSYCLRLAPHCISQTVGMGLLAILAILSISARRCWHFIGLKGTNCWPHLLVFTCWLSKFRLKSSLRLSWSRVKNCQCDNIITLIADCFYQCYDKTTE